MNLITGRLPESIELDGKSYPVNTDFKVWITIEELLGQRSEKALIKALCLCFKRLPEKPEKAISAMIDFLSGGEKRKKTKSSNQRLYDFSEDSGRILSSFLMSYNIDLRKSSMHWYVFLNLLCNLPEDSPFARAVFVRQVDLSRIKDKEQRKYYKKMKNCVKLKRSDEICSAEEDLGGAFCDD